MTSTSAPPMPVAPGVLVEPGWLRERLGHPRVRPVDLRDADAYAAGHVPGAVHLELATLGSRVDPCDNVLLPPAEFGELMSRLGISNEDFVIAYDDQWGLAAARLLWSLHRYGHGGVAVLDGGWDRWRAEGGACVPGAEQVTGATFLPRRNDEVHADLAWMTQRSLDGSAVLLDTRTPGEVARGHIPGAVGWDWFNAVPADSWGAARSGDELRTEWAGLGVEVGREVAVYCRSGMRAAHTYLALRHAGFQRVRLYDGSWQEWAAHMDRKNT